ncbi:MAG TPA: decarboxylating 6-phosphogluconate dehydrogenase [Elusimicrobiales bacterium]|nr:decarboxylating 6-phosphogluconate dehydrogenase [Elusimicrobiales bacterium]
MQIGIIGLGKMGANIAKRLIEKGKKVVVYNRTQEKVTQLSREGAVAANSYENLISKLQSPKILWLMLPAGEVTENALDKLSELLNEGDIIIDGANSFYKDSIVRGEKLSKKNIHFLDIGVSGGILGLETGYCIMAGGNKLVFDYIKPIMDSLCVDGGYLYCGGSGAGHFIKMVHNGIEYALMQAYGEGFEIIKNSKYQDDVKLEEVAHLWNRGSVIRSWLLELLEDVLSDEKYLETIEGSVSDSGEGRWVVKEAVDLEVPVPTIAESLFKRFRSRQKDAYSDKILAALRNKFGGHDVKKR